MSRFRIRPRFVQKVELTPEAVQDQIAHFFATEAKGFEVKRFPGFICIRIPESDRHFWSPRLNLGFDEIGESDTLINGVYGPNANVWSLFFYGYLLLGILCLVATILSISQWAIHTNPWGFWCLGGALIAISALYFAGQTGRKLGASQTLRLHRLYEKAIGRKISIR